MSEFEIHQQGQFEAYQPGPPNPEPAINLATAEVVETKSTMFRRVAASIAGVAMSAGIMIAPQAVDAMDRDDETHAVAFDEERAEKPMKDCPIIIAHRGSVGRMQKPGKNFTTENTVWAARRAQLLGADGHEFDNRDSAPDPETGKEETFVNHDGTVDRTFPGWRGKVSNKTPQQLMRMLTRDGSNMPISGTGEYLEDTLSTGWAETRSRPQRLKKNILNFFHQVEIKSVSNIPKFFSTVHDVIRAKQYVDPTKVIMWTTDKLRAALKINELDPKAKIGMIFFQGRPSSKLINRIKPGKPFTSFNVHIAEAEKPWVRDAHKKGMKVLVRTVNSLQAARKAVEVNADTIVTDNVGVVNAWNLSRRGICKAVRKNMPVITPNEPDPTNNPTPTPTETPTVTPSETPTGRPTETPSETPTIPTDTITPSDTSTPSATDTASSLSDVSTQPYGSVRTTSLPAGTLVAAQ